MMMLNTKIGGYSGISLNLIALGRTFCHIARNVTEGTSPCHRKYVLVLPAKMRYLFLAAFITLPQEESL